MSCISNLLKDLYADFADQAQDDKTKTSNDGGPTTESTQDAASESQEAPTPKPPQATDPRPAPIPSYTSTPAAPAVPQTQSIPTFEDSSSSDNYGGSSAAYDTAANGERSVRPSEMKDEG